MAELKIISMDEVAVEEVEWLWYPYIPYEIREYIEQNYYDLDFTVGGAVVKGRKTPLRRYRT